MIKHIIWCAYITVTSYWVNFWGLIWFQGIICQGNLLSGKRTLWEEEQFFQIWKMHHDTKTVSLDQCFQGLGHNGQLSIPIISRDSKSGKKINFMQLGWFSFFFLEYHISIASFFFEVMNKKQPSLLFHCIVGNQWCHTSHSNWTSCVFLHSIDCL